MYASVYMVEVKKFMRKLETGDSVEGIKRLRQINLKMMPVMKLK